MKIFTNILLAIIIWTLTFVAFILCYETYIIENELIYYKNRKPEIKVKIKRIPTIIEKFEIIYIDGRQEIKE